jgi:hypothetical protein
VVIGLGIGLLVAQPNDVELVNRCALFSREGIIVLWKDIGLGPVFEILLLFTTFSSYLLPLYFPTSTFIIIIKFRPKNLGLLFIQALAFAIFFTRRIDLTSISSSPSEYDSKIDRRFFFGRD